MRIIGPLPALCFGILLLFPLGFTWAFYNIAVYYFTQQTPATYFLVIAGSFLMFFFSLLGVYRIFIAFCPTPEGDLPIGSRGEFYWMISIAFWIVFFNLIVVNQVVPIPLTRIFYKILGAQVGKDTYFSGIIMDPHFTTFGSRVVLGLGAIIVPHVIEGNRLAHFKVQLGDNVTIGGRTIILAGTKIGAGSIIGAMSLVPKGTVIGENEMWAGVPVRFIKKLTKA